jgi:hypothetical protein
MYSNIYNLKVLNKTFEELDFELRLDSPEGEMISLGSIESVSSQNSAEGRFLVKLPANQLTGLQTEVSFSVYSNGKKLETVTSGFLGPANINNN